MVPFRCAGSFKPKIFHLQIKVVLLLLKGKDSPLVGDSFK